MRLSFLLRPLNYIRAVVLTRSVVMLLRLVLSTGLGGLSSSLSILTKHLNTHALPFVNFVEVYIASGFGSSSWLESHC